LVTYFIYGGYHEQATHKKSFYTLCCGEPSWVWVLWHAKDSYKSSDSHPVWSGDLGKLKEFYFSYGGWMKVYIAGPMTRYKDLNKPVFIEASISLMDMGYVVLNPAILPEGLIKGEYMDICFAMLRSANAIYLFEVYENSKVH
jgi:hypothetical protein